MTKGTIRKMDHTPGKYSSTGGHGWRDKASRDCQWCFCVCVACTMSLAHILQMRKTESERGHKERKGKDRVRVRVRVKVKAKVKDTIPQRAMSLKSDKGREKKYTKRPRTYPELKSTKNHGGCRHDHDPLHKDLHGNHPNG